MHEHEKAYEGAPDGPDVPPMDQWDIVSDPFERPKIYRHKVPLIKSDSDGKGVYLFVINNPGIPPIVMHDIDKSVSVDFKLTFLVDGEPIEIANAGFLYPPLFSKEGFLNMPPEGKEWLLLRSTMQNLGAIADNAQEIPFRLKDIKSESPMNDVLPPPESTTLRGIISGASLRALREAISLAKHLNNH